MAHSLFESMTSDWKPKEYTDDYRKAVMKLIHAKARKGGKAVEIEKKKASRPTKVIDLAEVLKQSLRETQAGKHRKKAA